MSTPDLSVDLSLPRTHVGIPRPVEGAPRGPAGPRRARPVPIGPRFAPDADEAREPESSRRLGRRLSIAVAITVAVLATTVTVIVTRSGPSGLGRGEAFVDLDGSASVRRADGVREQLRDRSFRLGPGDRMRVDAGTAELTLADEVSLTARSGVGDAPSTDLIMDLIPVLEAGPLLLETSDRSATVGVGFDGSTVEIARRGAARLDRTTALTVGVYRGRATVDSTGQSEQIGARRAVDLVAVGETSARRPLDYRADDDWDRRYLSEAMALDASLDALTSGARAGRVDPEAFAARAVRLAGSSRSSRSAGADGPSGSTGDGAGDAAAVLGPLAGRRRADHDRAIAVAVVAAASGDLEERWEAGIRFRDQGARWGLVAMELGSDGDRIVDLLLDALDDAPTLPPGVMVDETGSVIPPRSAGEARLATSTDDAPSDSRSDTGDGRAPVEASDPGSAPIDPGGVVEPGGPDRPGGPSDPPDPPTPGSDRPALELPVAIVPPVSTPPALEPLDPVVDALNDTTGAVAGAVTGLVGTVDDLVGELPLLGGLLGPVTGVLDDTASGLLRPPRRP